MEPTNIQPLSIFDAAAAWEKNLSEISTGKGKYIILTDKNDFKTDRKIKKGERKLSISEITRISVNAMKAFENKALNPKADETEINNALASIKNIREKTLDIVKAKDDKVYSLGRTIFVSIGSVLSLGFGYYLKGLYLNEAKQNYLSKRDALDRQLNESNRNIAIKINKSAQEEVNKTQEEMDETGIKYPTADDWYTQLLKVKNSETQKLHIIVDQEGNYKAGSELKEGEKWVSTHDIYTISLKAMKDLEKRSIEKQIDLMDKITLITEETMKIVKDESFKKALSPLINNLVPFLGPISFGFVLILDHFLKKEIADNCSFKLTALDNQWKESNDNIAENVKVWSKSENKIDREIDDINNSFAVALKELEDSNQEQSKVQEKKALEKKEAKLKKKRAVEKEQKKAEQDGLWDKVLPAIVSRKEALDNRIFNFNKIIDAMRNKIAELIKIKESEKVSPEKKERVTDEIELAEEIIKKTEQEKQQTEKEMQQANDIIANIEEKMLDLELDLIEVPKVNEYDEPALHQQKVQGKKIEATLEEKIEELKEKRDELKELTLTALPGIRDRIGTLGKEIANLNIFYEKLAELKKTDKSEQVIPDEVIQQIREEIQKVEEEAQEERQQAEIIQARIERKIIKLEIEIAKLDSKTEAEIQKFQDKERSLIGKMSEITILENKIIESVNKIAELSGTPLVGINNRINDLKSGKTDLPKEKDLEEVNKKLETAGLPKLTITREADLEQAYEIKNRIEKDIPKLMEEKAKLVEEIKSKTEEFKKEKIDGSIVK